MNLTDAQQEARRNPKVKAAVATSRKKAAVGAGITDDPDCEVELFPLVKDANEFFKGKKDALEAEGYELTYGTVGRGLVILERGEDAFSMSLVKRTTPRSGDRRRPGSE